MVSRKKSTYQKKMILHEITKKKQSIKQAGAGIPSEVGLVQLQIKRIVGPDFEKIGSRYS